MTYFTSVLLAFFVTLLHSFLKRLFDRLIEVGKAELINMLFSNDSLKLPC